MDRGLFWNAGFRKSNRRSRLSARHTAILCSPVLEGLETRAMLSISSILSALSQHSLTLASLQSTISSLADDYIDSHVPSQYRDLAHEIVTDVETFLEDLSDTIESFVTDELGTDESATSNAASQQSLSAPLNSALALINSTAEETSASGLLLTSPETVEEVLANQTQADGIVENLVSAVESVAEEILEPVTQPLNITPPPAVSTTVGSVLNSVIGNISTAAQEVNTAETETSDTPPAWHDSLTSTIDSIIDDLPAQYQTPARSAVDNFVGRYHDNIVDLFEDVNLGDLDSLFSSVLSHRGLLSLLT
jgi:hypothetical protein